VAVGAPRFRVAGQNSQMGPGRRRGVLSEERARGDAGDSVGQIFPRITSPLCEMHHSLIARRLVSIAACGAPRTAPRSAR
jgi:hypothetical protein